MVLIGIDPYPTSSWLWQLRKLGGPAGINAGVKATESWEKYWKSSLSWYNMINVWKHVPRIFTWKRVWIIQWILHFLSFLLGENLQETSVFGAAVNPWSNSRIGLRQLAELQIEKDRWMGTEEAANLQKIGGVGYRDFSKWPLSYNCDKCIYNHIIIYIYINHIINMIIMYPEINIMVGNHWTMKLSLYVNWCFHNIDVIYHLMIDCILYTYVCIIIQ